MRQNNDPILAVPERNRPERNQEGTHVRRVAAWCVEIGRKVKLPVTDCQVLERAALLHQRTELVVKADAWNSFRRDVRITEPVQAEDRQYAQVREVLRALHGDHGTSKRANQLAMILEQCDDLDSACELDAGIAADPDLNGLEEVAGEVAAYFCGGTSWSASLNTTPSVGAEPGAGALSRLRAAGNLPVFPGVATRVFALLADDNLNFGDLESIISSDQTLAGHMVAAANSAAVGGSTRVNSIVQAVGRIGVVAARRVVRASALRGMYRTPQSRALWNHSLDVGEAASRIAIQSGTVDGEEAFLAGLMHDLGKLVLSDLPAETLDRHDRLTQEGCPDLVVDRVVFGETHASVGAQLLREWHFADHIAAAVEHHHQPERNASPLCSVLYLAEAASPQRGLTSGLVSAWREELARDTLGLRNGGDPSRAVTSSALSGLRFAMAA